LLVAVTKQAARARPARLLSVLLAAAACAGCGSAVAASGSPSAPFCPAFPPAVSSDRFDEAVDLVSGPSGLQYGDISVGCGALVLPSTPGGGSTPGVSRVLTVEFTVWLDSGRELGTTRSPGSQPQTFTLGRGQVIPGFELGFANMRVGGKRRLVTPPALAFGAAGRPPLIPPNATLVWDVQLLSLRSTTGA
jgi:FKBP-type peptidyl-prolyl cis-trans isomerase